MGKNLDRLAKSADATKTLAVVAEAFVKRMKAESAVFTLGEPCQLQVKGRLPRDNHWHNEAFIGEEQFRLDSAYIVPGGKVCMTMIPTGASDVAHVRITLEEALNLLEGFGSEFQRYLEEAEDPALTGSLNSALERAKLEEMERARRDAGNSPEWGTW